MPNDDCLVPMPEIAASAWIAPGAHVVGHVTMSDESSIWYTAVARGDLERVVIGARSNIQDGCVLHADPGFPLSVGDDVSVGHRAVLHGCTIGHGVLVGMGAIVMNGAHVGESSVIGAGAVVPEGMHVPNRSLVVGIPGRVRGLVSDTQAAEILLNATRYVRLAAGERPVST